MLGPRIACLRRSAGLSQHQLAGRLKISPSAVGMYEQGRREPSVEVLVALAGELGVSLDYLLTGRAAPGEEARLQKMLSERLERTLRRLAGRKNAPFTPGELEILFRAVLEGELDEGVSHGV